jgi:hypothetical protein
MAGFPYSSLGLRGEQARHLQEVTKLGLSQQGPGNLGASVATLLSYLGTGSRSLSFPPYSQCLWMERGLGVWLFSFLFGSLAIVHASLD